jgi:hypothetical protein
MPPHSLLNSAHSSTPLTAIAITLGISESSARPYFFARRPYLACSRFLSILAVRPLSSGSAHWPKALVTTHRLGFAAFSARGSRQQQW